MPCYLDKCNKSCAIDTTSACPPVDPIDNTLGSPCTDPSQVPCLNELNAEDQIVDPFLQIEACGSIPMWNFTCDNNYSKEVRRYLFDGRFEDGNSGDQMAQFDEYQCFTGGLTGGTYAPAFTSAENVSCIDVEGSKGKVWAMTWKEMDGVTNDRLLVAPAAAGDTAVTLDTVEGIVVGGEITIIPCSDDPCFTHPFISEVTAVDPATGVVEFADPLPGAVFDVQASEDGCSTCETCVKYNHGAVACDCELPEGGRLPTHNVEYKYSYFENYGEIISFDDCDIKACYKCSYGCNKTGNGYVDGLYAVREKLGAFYKQMDEKMLQRYFFAKGPALNSVGAPLTGPGVITNILRQDALGCGCLVHDFCALNCAQKAAKIIDIMDDIECCQMDNSPNVRMIMNQIAYRNWKKLTREFNRLLGVPTCCEPQDGVKNFNRMAKVRGYISERDLEPELSYFLSDYYKNTGVVIFLPEGNTILRTFDRSIHNMTDDLNVINGTGVNMMRVTRLLTQETSTKMVCSKQWKIEGSYLIASIGCKKTAMVTGF